MSDKLNAPAKAASFLYEIYLEIKDKLHPRYEQSVKELFAAKEDALANVLIDAFGKGMESGVEVAKDDEKNREWANKEDESLMGYLRYTRKHG